MRFLTRLFRRSPRLAGREQVLALAAQGLDATAIARRTRLAHDVVALTLQTARGTTYAATATTRQKRPVAA